MFLTAFCICVDSRQHLMSMQVVKNKKLLIGVECGVLVPLIFFIFLKKKKIVYWRSLIEGIELVDKRNIIYELDVPPLIGG